MKTSTSKLVIRNGAIYTLNPEQPWVEALVIENGVILFAGSEQDAASFLSDGFQSIDLKGKMVLPGFVDAHAHASHAMDLVGNISLYEGEDPEEYLKIIKDFVECHPERDYYRGSGWSDQPFPNLGPNKALLDAIVPDKPLALISYDGHSMWVNSKVLERAGIDRNTTDPDGGRIERDPETGEPSGTLRETAFKLIEDVIPEHPVEEIKNALLEYQKMAARAGITLVHDPMLEASSLQAFHELAEEGLLNIRFRGSITLEPDQEINPQIEMVLSQIKMNKHPYYQIHSAKIFVDGVIEGGTAFLLEPYAHQPDFRGEPIWSPEILNDTCAKLDEQDIQIHLHVIGDAAARITLDALEHTQSSGNQKDLRHSVTHMHLVDPEDIPRFKELEIIGLPQPFWFKVDGYYDELALPYLGKARADRQYPMQSLIETGVIMASSSDFPVTIPFDPVIAIQTGITRSSISKSEDRVLWPEESASLEDLIRSYTYNGAYANFLEDQLGSLETGKLADLIILDKNLFEIPVNQIVDTKVLLTMVEGSIVHQDPSFSGDLQ